MLLDSETVLGPDRVYDGIAGSLDGQSTRWLVGRFGSGSCLLFLSTQPFPLMVIKATTIITAVALAVGAPLSGGISSRIC